jgi:hypothetical protein
MAVSIRCCVAMSTLWARRLWDALTVAAVSNLNVPRKLLATVAFGAERWDKSVMLKLLRASPI